MEKKSRYGKIFFSCNRYPQCKYVLWDQSVNEVCPKCGYPVIVERVTKRNGTYRKCPKENSNGKLEIMPPEKKETPAKAPAKKTKPKE